MRRRGDQGAATMLVLAAMGALLATAAGAAAVAEAVLARSRAALAADVAALAAASRVAAGADQACGLAARVAQANGARLALCRPAGAAVVAVTVTVVPPAWLGPIGPARLNARAGPAETYREEPAPPDPPS